MKLQIRSFAVGSSQVFTITLFPYCLFNVVFFGQKELLRDLSWQPSRADLQDITEAVLSYVMLETVPHVISIQNKKERLATIL